MILTVSVGAQTSKGILAGVARDTTGAVLPNVSVTVKSQDTGETRSVTTQADGAYRIEAIAPGKYTIKVVASGFTSSEVKDVTVVSSAVTSYDVTLSVGGTNTEVTVEANTGTINTTNGTLTGVVSALEIDKLPIFSLNPVELATTVPGVQTVSGSGFSNGIDIQVNGARPRSNNFLLDGQEINDTSIGGQAFQPQIPDIFDSLNVITNAASAEYGRAGGGIVNLVTKAGTNAFHGEVFERYAGSGLDSVPGGIRGTPFVKTRQNTHSYGFTAGGPIIKDKLFAFGALELQRTYGKETPGVNLLPDAAGYATLQSITGAPATQVQLLDKYLANGAYLTGDLAYPTLDSSGNQVAYTQNVGALPGCPAGGCVITFSGFQRPAVALNEPDTQFIYRIDYRPQARDGFTFRYLHDRSSLNPDFFNNPNALLGFDTEQGGPVELGEGSWTHVFSPKLVNELRGAEARLAFLFQPTPATLANPVYSLPTFNFSTISANSAAGSIAFPSLGPEQGTYPQGRREDLYQIQDTVSYTTGRHSFRIGFDIGRQIEIDLVPQNALGSLSFAKTGAGATSSLGNFLLNQLGTGGTANITRGPTRDDAHAYRNGAYAQDDIKFTPDLTINLGVRYDYLSDPENTLKYPGVDVSNPYAPIDTVVKINPDYNNISPRIGFAYSPHFGGFIGDGKSVIRGGFGIFYDSSFTNILYNSTQSAPNAVSNTLTSTASAPITNATGVIPTIPVAALSPFLSVLSEASNTVNPLTYQYNLGIEREMPGGIVLAIRYVGDRGEKEFANQQYNSYQNGTARINPARGAITVRGNYADSNYNSINVEASHNFSHGLDVRANYVYGKDLDDGSEVFTTLSSPTSYSSDLRPGFRGLDYGPSAYDHRQYFSLAYVYSPKGLHSDDTFTNAMYGIFTRHWTVSGVTQLQSGNNVSYNTSGVDTNGDLSTANDRPIEVHKNIDPQKVGIDGALIGLTPGVYYDTAEAFVNGNVVTVDPSQVHFLVPYGPNRQFESQEIGRGSYLTPGFTTNNFALEKGIGLSYLHFERGTVLLRAEASNVFNHNDSNVGDTDVLDAGEGFLGKARSESNRTVILWAKIQF